MQRYWQHDPGVERLRSRGPFIAPTGGLRGLQAGSLAWPVFCGVAGEELSEKPLAFLPRHSD